MYTLGEIAHFDRCLFPDDFRKSLIEYGVDETVAIMIHAYIVCGRKNRNVGIIELYQEFITDDKLTDVFDKIVNDFVIKSRSRK